jgi:hypothetical protein
MHSVFGAVCEVLLTAWCSDARGQHRVSRVQGRPVGPNPAGAHLCGPLVCTEPHFAVVDSQVALVHCRL